MLKKGVSSLIASVLVILISITAIAVVLMVGLPAIERAKEATAIQEGMRNMKAIAGMVDEIASEGVGSLVSGDIKVTAGEYKINEKANTIDLILPSSGSYVQPGSFVKDGEITMSSGSSAKASIYDIDGDGSDELVLENGIIRVGLLKNGTISNPSFMNTSRIVKILNFVENNVNVTPSNTQMILDGYQESSYGTGYSELVRAGIGLTKAEAVFHVNSTFITYDIVYTLYPGADFVSVGIQNAYYK
jgi:hypothetical protein